MIYKERLLKMVLVSGKVVHLLGPDDVVLDELRPPLYDCANYFNKLLKCKFVRADRDEFINLAEIRRVDDSILPPRVYFTDSDSKNFVEIPDNTFKKYKKQGVFD